jgi:AraC-like DNA-binding protein
MTARNRPDSTAAPGPRPLYVLDAAMRPLFAAAGPPYELAGDVGWDDVEQVLADAPPSAVVVAAPYLEGGAGDRFPALRRLLRRFASVPVVVLLELHPENTGDLMMLLEWGVSEVIAAGREATPAGVAVRLREAHARPFKRRLEGALSRYAGGDTRLVLRAAAEVAVDRGDAAVLADRLGVGPRTLAVRCRRAALPPPRQLQAWMRVLLAAQLLEDRGRTAASAARACGYATDRSLRRGMVRLLGAGPAELRDTGAFAAAAAAFNALLRDLREALRETERLRVPRR